MEVLLDTHVLLWWLSDDPSLSAAQRKAIEDSRNTCFISSATVWEISIKSALGKLTISPDYLEIVRRQGFVELAVSWAHAQALKALPGHHRDPFDRMLVAQARSEEAILLTSDEEIKKYDVKTIG